MKDVIGEKCLGDNNGNLTLSDGAKFCAWKNHYQMLVNVTFPWDKNFLNSIETVEGPAILKMIMMKIYRGYNGGCHQEDETRESRILRCDS